MPFHVSTDNDKIYAVNKKMGYKVATESTARSKLIHQCLVRMGTLKNCVEKKLGVLNVQHVT